MTNMGKEISTLTQALTTLTHKMVDKSSRRGDYESYGGYATEKSEKENTRPRNPRGKKNAHPTSATISSRQSNHRELEVLS